MRVGFSFLLCLVATEAQELNRIDGYASHYASQLGEPKLNQEPGYAVPQLAGEPEMLNGGYEDVFYPKSYEMSEDPDYWKAYFVYVRTALYVLVGLVCLCCAGCCCTYRKPDNSGYDPAIDGESNKQDFYGGMVSPAQADASIADSAATGIFMQRTPADNVIAVRKYVANFYVYYAVVSRYFIWTGGVLLMTAMMGLLTFMLSNQDNPAEAASVSSYVQDPSTPQGKLFKAFLIVGCFMVMFSGFGFFVLPRWLDDSDPNQGCCGCCFSIVSLIGYCCGICSPHRVFTGSMDEHSWVLQAEGRVKIWWQIVAIALFLVVAMIPVHTDRQSLLRAEKTKEFKVLPADEWTGQIHSLAAVSGCLLVVLMEYLQLFVGERVQVRFINTLQKLRLLSVSIGLLFLIGYVYFGYVESYPQIQAGPDYKGPETYYAGQAMGFVCEVLAIAFLAWDFILIGYIKPQATLVSIIFAGNSAPTDDFSNVAAIVPDSSASVL